LPESADILHFSPDGRLLASSHFETIRLWLVDQQRQLASWPASANVFDMVFRPDGRTIIALLGTNLLHKATLQQWDVNTGAEVVDALNDYWEKVDGVFTRHIAYSPDGEWFAFDLCKAISLETDSTGGSICAQTQIVLLNVASDRSADASLVYELGETSQLTNIAFSPDGTMLAVGHFSPITTAAWIDICSLSAHQIREKSTWSDVGPSVQAVTFSPDGKTLIAGFEHGSVRAFDVATGTELPTDYGAFRWKTNSIAFSPDGSLLAVGGGTLVDAVSGDHLGEIEGHGACLEFSPDGSLIATGFEEITLSGLPVP